MTSSVWPYPITGPGRYVRTGSGRPRVQEKTGTVLLVSTERLEDLMTTHTDADVKRRLCLVLDTDDLVEAERLAIRMGDYFGVAKIGLELFSAAGPEAIGSIQELGYEVFLDLKLFDIPTTVNRATRVLGALGVKYLTLHALGGHDVLRAGVEGLAEGAEAAGLDAPISLAVTVLTSDASAPAHIVPQRVRAALDAGCGGLVLAAEDLRTAWELAPRLVRVVPGIRLPGSDTNDQSRSATPTEAISAGADLLVVGRTVTQADDPEAAAAAVVDAVATEVLR